MAKDGRALRDEAASANAAGKYRRALTAYLELERLEPRDAQWAKRTGETYRRLGRDKEATIAYERAADRYAQNGFLVQAIAVCKLILQIDSQHADALRRLSQMSEQVVAGPTRAAGYAENNPNLHTNPNVNAIRRANLEKTTPDSQFQEDTPRARTPTSPRPRTKSSAPPPVAVPRTKSRPIALDPTAGIESVHLSREIPLSYERDETQPGVYVIPLEEPTQDDFEIIELEVDDDIEPEIELATELEFEDIEEIPLPEPRAIGTAAQRALASTPLFAGLSPDALEALVEHLELVPMDAGDILFREGDAADALYVVAEGEVAVLAEGPPRVEMARLGPGAFIGEVALMTDQPRSATVAAITAAELLRIDRATLSRVLANHGDVLRAVLRFVRDRLVDRWMRTSPLFRPFDEAQRVELAGRFNFLEIEAGHKVLTAGVRPDGLYIILAGQLVVTRSGVTLASLGPGDLIGETALLSGGPFKSEVTAHGKTLALCLPAADFREVIMTHPHVLEYIGEQAEQSRRLQIL